jgi:hypothetical protein
MPIIIIPPGLIASGCALISGQTQKADCLTNRQSRGSVRIDGAAAIASGLHNIASGDAMDRHWFDNRY